MKKLLKTILCTLLIISNLQVLAQGYEEDSGDEGQGCSSGHEKSRSQGHEGHESNENEDESGIE